MSARWQQVKEILQSALERPPDEREQFLVKVCAGDNSLRREVETLLASSENVGSFMDQAAIGKVADMFVSEDKNLQIGERLGHFKIIEPLGAGGMGKVYLAEDLRLHRRVALKVLPDDIAADIDYLRRFKQEALAVSALNHPNILTIYEIVESNGLRFIASEYVKGETLRQTIQNLTVSETLDIAVQIAAALDAAHRSGIVHRDIKPENIMRREDGIIKVLDFGLAKLMEKPTENADSAAVTLALVQTKSGLIMGTAAYMSPEQARGKAVDARTDIFSFGVVLYEMITGRLPFAGDTTSDVIAAILKNEPAPLARFVSDVPRELERIVGKCLRQDRDERYHHIKDLLIDLTDLKKELEFEAKLERSAAPSKALAATKFQTTRTTSGAEYVTSRIGNHKFGFVALSVLLLAAVGFGYWFFTNRSTNTKQIESIAVLPFVNESGNADVEYLSDGMTETLISSLSQLPKLNVKARSSVFRYKGKDVLPQTIGKELNVQAVLNGRFVQRGDELTLYLSLEDAQTNNRIWGKQYNRKLTNLVVLQTEIARDVFNNLSRNLKTKLSSADEQKLTENYTDDSEAYKLYLRGRFYWNKRTGEGLRKSIEFFKQAIERDPNYALAFAGLANAYVLFPVYSIGTPQDFFPKAKAAAKRALEIDETLAEAHTALAYAIFYYDWNLPESEKEFRRAIELNPNYATAHHWYGSGTLAAMKRFDEAIIFVKRAQELDPLSLVISVDLGYTYLYARQYEQCVEQLEKTLEMDQNFEIAHSTLGVAYAAKGSFSKAIAEYEKSRQFSDDPYFIALLGHAYGTSGKRIEALRIIEQLKEISKQRYVSAYNFAIVYSALGDKDKAFAELEKGYQDRANEMIFLQVDTLLDPLRDDPRFEDLLRRIGF